MHPILNIAVKAARAGSKIILRSLDRIPSISVSEKMKNDYVTDVDKQTEQEIIAVIRQSYPEHSFLAEESGLMENNPDSTWIIDPLDGTNNFIHGFPQFAISIAWRYKNRIEHGVVYDPLRDELFTASRGEGAHLNNRRIRVSECKKPEKALIGTGFPFRDQRYVKPYLASFEAMLPKVSDIRRAGAAALDLAYVAAGRLEGFWESGLGEWDLAAGVLLIKEAGGLISDFQGQETYFENGNIIASSPKLFKFMLQTIQPAFKGIL